MGDIAMLHREVYHKSEAAKLLELAPSTTVAAATTAHIRSHVAPRTPKR